MTSKTYIRSVAAAFLLLGVFATTAPAGELVLDMSQVGSVDCGDTFALAGRTCRLVELDEVRCIADDYHGMLLMSWTVLVVELGDLSDIIRVTAVVETVDNRENNNTFVWIYDGSAPVALVTSTVYHEPESLVLETVGTIFDSIRISGALLLLHEIRIETDSVPIAGTTWSAVKAAYR